MLSESLCMMVTMMMSLWGILKASEHLTCPPQPNAVLAPLQMVLALMLPRRLVTGKAKSCKQMRGRGHAPWAGTGRITGGSVMQWHHCKDEETERRAGVFIMWIRHVSHDLEKREEEKGDSSSNNFLFEVWQHSEILNQNLELSTRFSFRVGATDRADQSQHWLDIMARWLETDRQTGNQCKDWTHWWWDVYILKSV